MDCGVKSGSVYMYINGQQQTSFDVSVGSWAIGSSSQPVAIGDLAS